MTIFKLVNGEQDISFEKKSYSSPDFNPTLLAVCPGLD